MQYGRAAQQWVLWLAGVTEIRKVVTPPPGKALRSLFLWASFVPIRKLSIFACAKMYTLDSALLS
jgi:hypothetical protein